MGTSKTPFEMASKIARLGGEIREIPKAATGASALHVKKAVMALAPSRLRGVGKRGAKIGVKYDVIGVGESVYAHVYTFGPFSLIERSTRSHTIPKPGSKRKGRLRVAVIPGVGPRSGIHHPGTKGKYPWRKGVEIAKPQVTKEFQDALITRMRQVF